MTHGFDDPDREFRLHRPLTRLLHWCVFVLVIVAAGTIIARGLVGGSAERKLLLVIHQSAGLAVLGLTVVRMAWRLGAQLGALHAQLPLAMRIGATATHAALYFTVLALTVLGWLTSNACARPLSFFCVIPLPALIGRDRSLGDDLQEWHSDVAWLLLLLVIAHVAAALWHHFLRGDGVMRSMAPFRRGPTRGRTCR
jgi:cytochrome b561